MPTAVIYDLEFTAWEGSMAHRWLRPGEFREIVQIGAVRLDTATLRIVRRSTNSSDHGSMRPLSPYLERLTGISNAAMKAQGRDLAEVLPRFASFCGAGVTSAFGRDDLVIADNVRLYGLGSTPRLSFVNLQPWFRAHGFDTRGVHSCDVGPRLRVPFEGHTHNALADTRSLAAACRCWWARGAPSPFSDFAANAKTAA